MLVYSEEHLLVTDVNVLTIAAKGGGYFYVHRILYDQAVILDDLYSDNPHDLIKAITGGYKSRGDIVTFMRDMPKPLNILGPYLILVTEQIDELIDMVGAIHVMSGSLNFRAMLKIPFAMRHRNPKFSLGIRDEYKLSWDMFLQKTLPYNTSMLQQMAGGAPIQSEPVSDVVSTPRYEEEEEVEEVEMTEEERAENALENASTLEEAMDGLMNLSEEYWANIFNGDSDEEEEVEVEETQTEAPVAPTPVSVQQEEVPAQSEPETHPEDIVGALLNQA